MIFIKRDCYVALKDITAGDLFVEDSNVKKIILANYLSARYDPIAEKIIFGGIESTESIVDKTDYHVYDSNKESITILRNKEG